MTYKEVMHSAIILLETAKQKLVIQTNLKRDHFIILNDDLARMTLNPNINAIRKNRIIYERDQTHNELKRLEEKLAKLNNIIIQAYSI